ncbi:MAG: MCT family MFS transporter [Burkholderiaceae bacterium]
MRSRTRPYPYFGWAVVAAAFTLMFTGFGVVYSFAAFFKAVQTEFGAPRAHVSMVFSLCAFLYFVLGAPAGMLADRFGPRRVSMAGVAVLSLGLAGASFATSLEVLYITYSVAIGVGVGLTYVPSVGAVQPWFNHRRAFATGIAVAGIGAGNLIVPPLAAWWIELFGWRGAYLALAGFSLVLAGVAACVIDNDPDRKERRLGEPSTRWPPPEPLPGMTLTEALRSRIFWILYGSLFLPTVGVFVPMVHLAPYATDLGYPESAGVMLVSLIGLGSLLGRFCIGGLADRMGRMFSLALMFAGLGASFIAWWMSESLWALGAMAVAMGLFYGGFVATMPAVVMDIFGGRAVSAIIGWLYTAPGIGTLFGPTLAGYAFDRMGSYDAPILGAALLSFIGAAAVYVLARSRKWAG